MSQTQVSQTQVSQTQILVVDDSSVNRALTAAQLKRLGHNTHLAQSGTEALAMFESLRPRLTLLDWHMPAPNGLETAKQLRVLEANRQLERTPIVALTAQAMAGDRESCLAAGMDDFLSKPVRLADLQRVLQHWISPHSGAQVDSPVLGRPEGGCPEGGRPDGYSPDTSGLTKLINPVCIQSLTLDLGPSVTDQLVETFLAELSARLQASADDTDLEAQSRAFHTIKTAAALIGAETLSAKAAELERSDAKERQSQSHRFAALAHQTAKAFKS